MASTRIPTGWAQPAERNPIWGLDVTVEDEFEDASVANHQLSFGQATSHYTFVVSGLSSQRLQYQVLVEQYVYVVEPAGFELGTDWQDQIGSYLNPAFDRVVRGSLNRHTSTGTVDLKALTEAPESFVTRKPLTARFIEWISQVLLSATIDEPERAARIALSERLIEKSPWAEAVGPLYTESGFAALLDWPIHEVELAAARGQILFLVSEEGQRLFPAAQVAENGRVASGLPWVLRKLSADLVDRYTLAAWLNARRENLNDQSIWSTLHGETGIPTIVREMTLRWKSALQK